MDTNTERKKKDTWFKWSCLHSLWETAATEGHLPTDSFVALSSRIDTHLPSYRFTWCFIESNKMETCSTTNKTNTETVKGLRERKRERERERERERNRDRDWEGPRLRERDRQVWKQRLREMNRQRETGRDKETDRRERNKQPTNQLTNRIAAWMGSPWRYWCGTGSQDPSLAVSTGWATQRTTNVLMVLRLVGILVGAISVQPLGQGVVLSRWFSPWVQKSKITNKHKKTMTNIY